MEFLRDLYQRLQAEKEGTQEQADDVERAFRIARRMYPDAINQVAKVHDRAEGLAKEVERLQRQVESFEADADYHRAQRETIKRHEDQIRDLKVMVSAAEAKLAIYEAPRAAEGPTMHEQSVEIDRLTTEVSALSAAHAECKGENTKLREALKFYADPLAHGADGTPDFYDEMDFGERARAAIASVSEEACSHPKTVLHHTGDGAPVEFCPDCGRNVAIGNPPAKEGTTE